MAPLPAQKRGFTLIELLIAAGIFGVGLIAVASIFPTAIQLQKQTIEQIRGDEFSNTVRTTVSARGFDERVLAQVAETVLIPRFGTGFTATEPPVVFSAPTAVDPTAAPIPGPALAAPYDAPILGWPLGSRSTGSLEPALETDGAGNFTFGGNFFQYNGRKLFWTPLFIDYNDRVASGTGVPEAFENRTWGAFIFVLQASPNTIYPRTAIAPVDAFALDATIDKPQDKVLDPGPSNLPVADPYLLVPGVARIDVTIGGAGGNEFQFVNGVTGPTDTEPIVRIGDQILAENGISYQVEEVLLGGMPPNVASLGVRVRGTIIDRVDNPVTEIWAAHPGDSGESSFVKLIQLVDQPGLNNLIR